MRNKHQKLENIKSNYKKNDELNEDQLKNDVDTWDNKRFKSFKS